MMQRFAGIIFLTIGIISHGLPANQGNPQPQPGKKLVVGTKVAPPFSMKEENGRWVGISIELWEDIAADMQIVYEFQEMDLPEMFDALKNRSIDVAVAALTITAEREKEVDFTHPFYTTGLSVAVPARKETAIWTVLKRVISPDFLRVVATLCLVLLAFGFLVWLFERRKNPQQFGGSPLHGIGAGFWWSAVTMTTVGYGDKAPVSFGGRMIGLIWMFAAIIIISTFTAAIATTLTVNQLQANINGPEDLPSLRIATVKGSSSEAYLREKRITYLEQPRLEEALRALVEGRVDAVVYDAPILRFMVNSRWIGKVQVLPFTFTRQDYGIALPPDSPMREQLVQAMLEKISEPQWQDILYRYLGN